MWTKWKWTPSPTHLTSGEGHEQERSKGLTTPDLEEWGLEAWARLGRSGFFFSLFYCHCPSLLIRRAGLIWGKGEGERKKCILGAIRPSWKLLAKRTFESTRRQRMGNHTDPGHLWRGLFALKWGVGGVGNSRRVLPRAHKPHRHRSLADGRESLRREEEQMAHSHCLWALPASWGVSRPALQLQLWKRSFTIAQMTRDGSQGESAHIVRG